MSEETKSADFSAPWGIIIAISTSAFVGWGYILALLFSIQVQRSRHNITPNMSHMSREVHCLIPSNLAGNETTVRCGLREMQQQKIWILSHDKQALFYLVYRCAAAPAAGV